MLKMPKCHDCGKFCRPVEWQMIYSGALPEPQEEIYKCASCVEKNGSFVPQSGIKPEHSCGVISDSSPKGRTGLGIREWTCVDCGSIHDRDQNAAKNILAVGLGRLAGGIPGL